MGTDLFFQTRGLPVRLPVLKNKSVPISCIGDLVPVGLRASPDTARGRIEKGRHMEKDHTMKKMRGWSTMVLSVLWLLVAHVTTAEERPVPPFGVFTMLEGQ